MPILAALGPAVLAAQEAEPAIVLTIDDAIALALRQNPFHLASQEKIAQARAGRPPGRLGLPADAQRAGLRHPGRKALRPGVPVHDPGRAADEDVHRLHQGLPDGLLLRPAPLRGRTADGRLQAGQPTASRPARNRSACPSRRPSSRPSGPSTAICWRRSSPRSAQEGLALAEKFMLNVKNLHEVGMASKFDLLRSEVQVANLKPQAIRARNSVDVAALGLKTVCGIDLDTPIEVKGELVAPPLDGEARDIVAEALDQRPELRQLDYQRGMAGEMLKMARGALLPTLALGGQYNVWSDALNLRKGTWSELLHDQPVALDPALQRIRDAGPDRPVQGRDPRARLDAQGPHRTPSPSRSARPRSTSARPGRPCSPWRRTSNRPARPSASRS
ncbi:MAG: TolC family protein [Marinilabiliales bacterium]|nr:TolC family protein [Marinilabiliales bacterium]